MDSRNKNTIQKATIFRLTLIMLFFSTTLLFSQAKSDTGYDLPQIAIDNYLAGALSDNHGLKASCIYFLGKYKVLEANSQLIEQIGDTEDESLKILIAWSLYRIGEDSGLDKLEYMAVNSKSQDVKAFCSNLHGIKMLENALSEGYVRLPYSQVYTD